MPFAAENSRVLPAPFSTFGQRRARIHECGATKRGHREAIKPAQNDLDFSKDVIRGMHDIDPASVACVRQNGSSRGNA